MKDSRKGIDAEAPVKEIVDILAKHGVSIGLIDQVFERAKNRAINHTIVTSDRTEYNQHRKDILCDNEKLVQW